MGRRLIGTFAPFRSLWATAPDWPFAGGTRENYWENKATPHAQARLWRKAIETRKSMGIPTDDKEKELKDLMESTTDRMMNDE